MINRSIKNLALLLLLIAMVATSSAQDKLEVEGHSSIKGRLALGHPDDLQTVYIGFGAGVNTNFGSPPRNNTFVGYFSGLNNNTGKNNSFFGGVSGGSNTAGSNNSFFGLNAGVSNQGGSDNSFYGMSSGFSTVNGSSNTAMGKDALYNNTSGQNNTSVGHGAMRNNKIGENNTAIGYEATFGSALGNLNNTTCIGYQAGGVSNNHNRIEVGNTSVSWIGGQVNWSTYSDARIKKDVRENVPGLSFISRLRPVTYHLDIHKQNEMCFKGDKSHADWEGKYDIENNLITGFIAQEVKQAAQELDYEFSGVHQASDEVAMYSLRYAEFVVPLVKAVQEQQQLIEALKAENASFKEELCNLKLGLHRAGLVSDAMIQGSDKFLVEMTQ